MAYLNRLLRQSKQNHYHQILNENKGNSKITWDVVNELANQKSRNSSVSSLQKIFSDSKRCCIIFNIAEPGNAIVKGDGKVEFFSLTG